MVKKLLFPLFFLMLAAQWIVPGKLIYDSEKTSAEGTLYKFKIRPFDPYDPFRGKYITLDFEDETVLRDTLEVFASGQSVFVQVESDPTGIARVKTVSNNIFPGSNYFEATALWQSHTESDSLSVQLEFPFKKFFMEETLAPQAEQEYSRSRSDTIPAFALVRIKDGRAILRDVIIHDSSIVEVVRARKAKK